MAKTLLVLMLLSCSSCAGGYVFEGTWAGDSKTGAIERKQEGRAIKCTDPEFDKYLCGTPESWWAVKRSCQAN